MKTRWQTIERNYSARHGDYFVRYGFRRLYLGDFLWYGKILKIDGELVIGIHKSGAYFYAVYAADCDSDFDEIDEATRVRIIRVTNKNVSYIE